MPYQKSRLPQTFVGFIFEQSYIHIANLLEFLQQEWVQAKKDAQPKITLDPTYEEWYEDHLSYDGEGDSYEQ